MAVITISNTGGNWNATTTWVGGVIPGAADDVIATATSGPLTVNVASSCKSIVLTNYTSTLTLNAILDVFGTVTLVAGMTLAGTNQLRFNTTATLTSAGKTIPWALLFSGTSQTYTLGDNWTVTGNISCTATTAVTINSNQINANANFSANTAGVSGTTNIVMGGTGTLSSTGPIRNNLTINTSGTITIGNLLYNTGTLTYTTGTVSVTAATTLTCAASTTLNVNGITWVNVTFTGAATITLTSNLTLSGNLVTQTGAVVINGAAQTVSVGGNLTINNTTSGTASIVMNGTGTWSTTGFNLSNNLTFNTSGTITISSIVYYITGTMTYTAGTMVTTGSTLSVGTCTLNTSGMNWLNFSATSATVTMSSNLNITGTLTTNGNVTFTSSGGSQLVTSGAFSCSNSVTNPLGCTITLPNIINVTNLSASVVGNLNVSVAINGSGVNISGNLSAAVGDLTYSLSGTAPLNMVGTGTISTTGGAQIGRILSAININTSGIITLGTNAHFGGALTYTSGTFNGNNSLVLLFGGFNLNGFNDIYWDCTVRTGYNLATITLNSNLNVRSFVVGGSCTINGAGVINCGSFSINNTISGSVNTTPTLNVDVYVSGSTTFGPGPSGDFQINGGKTIFVGGDLSMTAPTNIYGSTIVRMVGTGTISSAANWRQFDLIIDTPGNINITSTLYWNLAATAIAAKTITYLRGKVIVAKSAGLYIGNLNVTFTNMHKIPWPTVTITSGQTITLNEFFSGTSSYKTVVQPTSTTNYTITFTDNLERFARNVKISRATLTRPDQLTVITDKGNNGNNVGIKFYSNQMPNGIAKNAPSVPPQTTFLPGGLLSDPAFI